MLAAAFIVLNLYFYLLLPVLAGQNLYWMTTALLFIVVTPSLWALIHEAFHGLLHPSPPINAFVGRTLAIVFGAPYAVLRAGHLLHHRFNRSTLDRTEVFDTVSTPRWRAHVVFFSRLLFGLYVAELASVFLVWLPQPVLRRMQSRLHAHIPEDASRWLEEQLLTPRALARLRLDAVLIIVLLSTGIALYGAAWPVLALGLFGRAVLVSMLDNAFHYGTNLSNRRGAMNFSLPAWVSHLILHFNLHDVHHRLPQLCWIHLPRAFAETNGQYHYNFLIGCLRQLRGPIVLSDLVR